MILAEHEDQRIACRQLTRKMLAQAVNQRGAMISIA